MTAIRLSGQRALNGDLILPGDTVLIPDAFANITTVGNGSLLASALVQGVVYRTGPTGAYSDAIDNPSNIFLALSGNIPGPAIVPGLGFKFRLVNTVAFVETITGIGSGVGWTSVGPVTSVAASTWRDYLVTFTNVQVPITNMANTTNGSNIVTWYLPPGQTAELIGPSNLAINITPGCTIQGTGIANNATVSSITMGQGGTLGFVMSSNATATGTVALTFGPTAVIASSGSGTL